LANKLSRYTTFVNKIINYNVYYNSNPISVSGRGSGRRQIVDNSILSLMAVYVDRLRGYFRPGITITNNGKLGGALVGG